MKNLLNKKGQGLSLQVIIIAILVLIVLVVLVLVFTGKIGGFGEATQGTEEKFSADNCEIPGTGRYCSFDACEGKSVAGNCPLDKGTTCCTR